MNATRWPLLESLPADARDQVLRTARRRRFARGEVVFHEGDPADSLHLVDNGLFAVNVTAPNGDRLTVNVLSAGDFFGELALLHTPGTTRRSATVSALVPGQTLTLAGTAFAGLRSSHPAIGDLVATALAQRVDDLSRQLLEALYFGVDRRVYRCLNALADIYGKDAAEIVIPLSQSDVAMMAGAARPTVNQVLQRLVSRGVISLGRRQIRIEDIETLRAMTPAD